MFVEAQNDRDNFYGKPMSFGRASAHVETRTEAEPFLRVIRDAQEVLHFQRELLSKSRSGRRDETPNQRVVRLVTRASAEIPDTCELLASSMGDLLKDIRHRREISSELRQISREETDKALLTHSKMRAHSRDELDTHARRDTDQGPRSTRELLSRSAQIGRTGAHDELPGQTSRDAREASYPNPGLWFGTRQIGDDFADGVKVEEAPSAQVRPLRQLKRAGVWAGVIVLAGILFTGVYARDSLKPAGAAVARAWHGIHLFKGPSSAPAGAHDVKSKPEFRNTGSQVAANQPIQTSRPASRFPVPESYGLYVVSNGQLTRLEAMQTPVPNPRIAISGLITRPSPVVVPNGRVFFVAYQRDLMTNAPDGASVRVVAQVMRALKSIGAGKPIATAVEDTWAARSVTAGLTVGPIPNQPEMVVIKPSNAERSLSPGRYMLVFKNQAYDFAVEGVMTDTAQCLERTDTENGTAYTECRNLR